MGITRLNCPACAAALKFGRALDPGQRIKCPRCAAIVTVPAIEGGELEPERASRPGAIRKGSPSAKAADIGANDPKDAQARPRKRRKKSKKPKANPALFWGLIGGGAAAVGLLVVVLILVFSGKKGSASNSGGDPQQAATNKLLTGEWESTGAGKKYTLEFTSAGKVRLSGGFLPLTEFRFAKPLKMYADFGMQPGGNLDITYRCLSDTQLEIRANYTPLLEKLSAGATKAPAPEIVEQYKPTETLTYAVTETEMILTNDRGKSVRLQRGG